MDAKEALEIAEAICRSIGDSHAIGIPPSAKVSEAAATLRRLIPFVERTIEYCNWKDCGGGHPFPSDWPAGLDVDTRLIAAYRAMKEGE